MFVYFFACILFSFFFFFFIAYVKAIVIKRMRDRERERGGVGWSGVGNARYLPQLSLIFFFLTCRIEFNFLFNVLLIDFLLFFFFFQFFYCFNTIYKKMIRWVDRSSFIMTWFFIFDENNAQNLIEKRRNCLQFFKIFFELIYITKVDLN